MLLLNLDKASREILLAAIAKNYTQVTVEEKTYYAGFFADAQPLQPELIVLDVSRMVDCSAACTEALATMPRTPVLLVRDSHAAEPPLCGKETVLQLPFAGCLQKPLTQQRVLQKLEEIEQKRASRILTGPKNGVFYPRDLVDIFEHSLLLTHLYKGTASPQQMHEATTILGGQNGNKRYYRVFAIQNQNSDPLNNNFTFFAFLKRHISSKHMVVCSGPTQLTGIVATATPDILPEDSIEWKTLQHWLQNKTLIPQPLFISFSASFSSLTETPQAYQCAITGLNNAFFMGYGTLASNSQPAAKLQLHPNTKRISDDFALLLLAKNRSGLLEYIGQLYEEFKQMGIDDIFGIQQVYVQLLYRLNVSENILRQKEIPDDIILENARGKIRSVDTLQQLHNRLEEKIKDIFEETISKTSSAQANAMHILEYVRSNYHNPSLSLLDISENVYLSPSHLSAEFKKVMGQPVGKYINQYRIQQALQLLANPAIKLDEIAKMVGFTDARQFAKVFKRLQGKSPTQYRKLQSPRQKAG
ncbi:AraC family transcriptional regulator [Ruminococcaceae bacterium OttesenSCG-928-A16]|nr:AraC family transcriptional regulator [Ruminococcaceae bacterium OttesenSCG-928-A16]